MLIEYLLAFTFENGPYEFVTYLDALELCVSIAEC